MSTWFVVRHSFKLGQAPSWWEAMSEIQADQAKFGAWMAACAEAGFHNHTFLATGLNTNSYCVWEAREGKTAADFQAFIDGPLGPTQGGKLLNECMQISVDLAGSTPFPSFFTEEGGASPAFKATKKPGFLKRISNRLSKKGSTNKTESMPETTEPPAQADSSIYLVQHTFKHGKAEGWWQAMAGVMGDADKMAAFQAAQKEAGFNGLAFMPTGTASDCWCLWEAAPGKTGADMESFIDGPLGPSLGAFVNKCIPIDLPLCGGAPTLTRAFSEFSVVVELQAAPGKLKELMAMLTNDDGLNVLAGWEGAEHVELYADPATPGRLLIWEKWANQQSQQSYLQMRTDTGFFDAVTPLLASQPLIKPLHRCKDGEERRNVPGGEDRFTVFARFEAAPEKLHELVATFEGAMKSTHEFPGNLAFEIYTDASDPNAVLLWEQWESQEVFKSYIAMRTESGFIPGLKPMLAAPPTPAPISFMWGVDSESTTAKLVNSSASGRPAHADVVPPASPTKLRTTTA